MTSTEQRLEASRFMFEYRYAYIGNKAGLSEIVWQLSSLQTLTLLASYIDQDNEAVFLDAANTDSSRADRNANLDARTVMISYNSPLQVILEITTSGLALLSIANKWATVRARLAKSSSEVAFEETRRAAIGVLREVIENSYGSAVSATVFDSPDNSKLEMMANNAASVLMSLESIKPLAKD